MRLKYFLLLAILFLSPSVYGQNLAGKWQSSTKNTIYIYKDPGELRIQVVLDGGETYTWTAKWIKKGRVFGYTNHLDSYIGTVENKNTIIVTGEKTREIFVWRKVKWKRKRIKKAFRPEKQYRFSYCKIKWKINNGEAIQGYMSTTRNRDSLLYTWNNDNGKWLGMVFPIISLEHPDWGVTAHFKKVKGKWQLVCFRPVKLIRKRRSSKGKWKVLKRNVVYVNGVHKWSLKFLSDYNFQFTLKGPLKLGRGKSVFGIKVRGRSKTLVKY